MTDAPRILLHRDAIERLRIVLAARPTALVALDEIEACEGDLGDAAIDLAIRCGQLPDRDGWLDGLTKRCRSRICTNPALRDALGAEDWTAAFAVLDERPLACPDTLVLPVLLWARSQGLDAFCDPLDRARPSG